MLNDMFSRFDSIPEYHAQTANLMITE